MDDFTLAVVVLLMGGGFGFGYVINGHTSINEAEAVKHNCAQYNPTTGEFMWKEKK